MADVAIRLRAKQLADLAFFPLDEVDMGYEHLENAFDGMIRDSSGISKLLTSAGASQLAGEIRYSTRRFRT